MTDTFSTEVRRQLAGIRDDNPCCRRTLLEVLLQVYLSRRPARGEAEAELELDPGPTARLIYKLGREFCGPGATLRLDRAGDRAVLALRQEELAGLLQLDRRALPRACCRRAYLRGAFLSCGSLVSPRKGYHMEFDAAAPIADKIGQVCFREAILLKQYRRPRRQGQVTAYLKNSEAILGFLALIGAHGAVLDWQKVAIEKEMRNQVQRSVNCETSNISKTVRSAQQLIARIARMRETGVLNGLPAPLKQAALLRESYPFATLQELAELAEPPVSKSGLNHRLRELRRVADRQS